MWQPVTDDADWDSDRTLSFVPGWGPYLFISGWMLSAAAPMLMFVGAPHVARIHGDLVWIAFVLLCIVGTVGGMTLLVHHRRLQRRHQRPFATVNSVPVSDLIWGFGLLGLLAASTVVVFLIRWLR